MYPPPGNKGVMAGLIKENQWLISADHKGTPAISGGGYVARGGVG